MKAINLKQNPCTIVYLEKSDVFIVGTYRLKEFPSHETDESSKEKSETTDSKHINNREGSLYIISPDATILNHHRCENGGVFDIKILYRPENKTYTFYLAHSNGHITEFELTASLNLHQTQDYTVAGSSLLTCLDVYNRHSDNQATVTDSAIVGDSDGYVSVICRGKSVARQKVTSYDGFSVWQVKVVNFDQSMIFLVGSDDCTWRIYMIKEFELTLLQSIKDFEGGITSFAIIPRTNRNSFDVYVGSYDETIRRYTLDFNENESDDNTLDVVVNCIAKIRIPESGVWRIKKHSNKEQLMISGMYSGCYIIPSDLSSYDEIISPSSEEIKIDEKPLFYDIDLCTKRNIYGIVDFNNERCYMLDCS